MQVSLFRIPTVANQPIFWIKMSNKMVIYVTSVSQAKITQSSDSNISWANTYITTITFKGNYVLM